MTFYRFQQTAWVQKWGLREQLYQKRGRDNPAAAHPGWELGLAHQHLWGPKVPQAPREQGWVKGAAAILVDKTTNAQIMSILYFFCLRNSQIFFSDPKFHTFFFFAFEVIFCHIFKILGKKSAIMKCFFPFSFFVEKDYCCFITIIFRIIM